MELRHHLLLEVCRKPGTDLAHVSEFAVLVNARQQCAEQFWTSFFFGIAANHGFLSPFYLDLKPLTGPDTG
jgi:hypothetical protein